MQGPEKCVRKMWVASITASLRLEPYKFIFWDSVSRYSQTDTANAGGGKTNDNFLSTAAK